MQLKGKAAEAYEQLKGEVAALTTSEAWMQALDNAAKFHKYSFGNTMLMWAQAMDRGIELSQVAGYRRWQQLGRQVRKGEKGLVILAPILVPHEDEPTRKVLVGFKTTHVFDISQTEGDEVPLIYDFAVELDLEGPDTVMPVLELLEGEGFETFVPSVDPYFSMTGALGFTRWEPKEVHVKEGTSSGQQFKTLLHEAGHVLLHGNKEDRECRGIREMEAESVAYVVAKALGLDTDGYSFGYIAIWAHQSDRDVEEMSRLGGRVVKAAHQILERYELKAEVAA